MQINVQWRSIFILGIILFCIFGLIGLPTSLSQARETFSNHIKLGLDLRGGTHLILQVQAQEAVKTYSDQSLDRLRRELSDKGIRFEDIGETDDSHIQVRNIAPDQASAFLDLIRTSY